MRILFASTNLPVAPNNGQAIRTLSILQALAASGHGITFLSFAAKDRPKTLHPLSSYCREIHLLERTLPLLSQHSDYLCRLKCLIEGKAYSVERFRSSHMRDKIQQHLRTGAFDVVVADSLYSLVNVPETDIPVVLNCHNVEHILLERYAKLEKNLAKRCYARIEARLMRRTEQESCRRANLAMVCSSHDRDVLRQVGMELPITVVPNALDTGYYRPQPNVERNTSETILFLGGMDWYPNRDAVGFFATKVLPLVRAECPAARFVIAGRNPPVSFTKKFARYQAIEFTGTVPDMRPYLSAASVVVVPLRLGSGTRIKILEACAMGKPVVSTSVGAEGLELKAGKEIILADNAADFARAVIALLRDPARCEAIGRSARAVIVECYSQPVVSNKLDEAIQILPRIIVRSVGSEPFESCPNRAH